MKALGFAAALATGALLAGPASAFVIVYEDVFQGPGWQAPPGTLVDGATLYVRFESAAPVSAFSTDVFQKKSYEWYYADGSLQHYGNDNPHPIHLDWQPVNGAMEAVFTLPTPYRIGDEGEDYVLWYYQQRSFAVFYNAPIADYRDVPWKITYSDAPIASVPEPSSWALMIVGFGLAGAALRRRSPARSAADAGACL